MYTMYIDTTYHRAQKIAALDGILCPSDIRVTPFSLPEPYHLHLLRGTAVRELSGQASARRSGKNGPNQPHVKQWHCSGPKGCNGITRNQVIRKSLGGWPANHGPIGTNPTPGPKDGNRKVPKPRATAKDKPRKVDCRHTMLHPCHHLRPPHPAMWWTHRRIATWSRHSRNSSRRTISKSQQPYRPSSSRRRTKIWAIPWRRIKGLSITNGNWHSD